MNGVRCRGPWISRFERLFGRLLIVEHFDRAVDPQHTDAVVVVDCPLEVSDVGNNARIDAETHSGVLEATVEPRNPQVVFTRGNLLQHQSIFAPDVDGLIPHESIDPFVPKLYGLLSQFEAEGRFGTRESSIPAASR